MATIKLKKPEGRAPFAPAAPSPRAPVRGAGAGVKARPTLAQAQALRVESEARYQEQLRQRFGERAPPAFTRRDRPAPPPPRGSRRDAMPPQRRDTGPQHPMPGRDVRGPRDARDTRGPGARPDPINTAFRPRFEREPQRPDAPFPPAQRLPAGPPQRGQRALRLQPDWDDQDDHVPQAHLPGSMRLSKRMSELGIASRREADEWIPKGWVRVDGRVVSELGSRVLPTQQITVDAKAKFVQAQKVTVILNKPIGYVSGQAEDGYEPAVVLVKPANQWREDQSGTRYLLTHLRGIAPAGRLDIDSIGLLVLTQDGRIAKQLIGEDSEMEKEYLVRVEAVDGGGLSDAGLALLNHGLELDGEPLREARVEWINDDQLRFVLKEGKKRQIRRMCEAVGLKVVGLKRVRIGGVMLGDLPVGQWRYLRGDESFVPLRPPTAD